MPIKYKVPIFPLLKNAGYNTSRLRKEKILAESTLQALREGKAVSADNLSRICAMLNCQPGDIIEYVADGTTGNTPSPAEQPCPPIIKELSAEGAAELTEKQQATILMDKFIDLQRIKTAADREREIEYQLRTTKAKLKALGIVTEALTIEA